MRSLSFCLLFVVVVCASACSKKSTVLPPPPGPGPVVLAVYPDYARLAPGNYWIYQEYKVDSVNGPAHALGTFDSCYVEKDTVMDRKVYHKYCSVKTGSAPLQTEITYLRDSLNYLVNSAGVIQFSSGDFRSVFRSFTMGANAATPDTLYVTEQMGFANEKVSVDAGTFTTSTFRRIFRFPATYPYGRTREYNYRYSAGIGLVSATRLFYYNSPEYFEKRLVRYHVK